jgi:oligopeptide transport system substrate-binding protein
MNKKIIVLLATIVLLMPNILGCSNEEKVTENVEVESNNEISDDNQQKTTSFSYSLTLNPFTIDPTLVFDNNGYMVVSNTFEGLVEIDKMGKPIPAAAESWTANDEKNVYTFKLRKDGKWSDGSPVKAQDFVYSWRRAADPITASEFGYFMYYIKNGEAINNGEMAPEELGVVASDDYTLVVTLEKPVNYIYHMFAFPTYFPVKSESVETDHERWILDPKTYISNGPYKLEDWKQNEEVVLKKNENYWNADIVSIDRVNLKVITDSSTALSAYEADQIDGIYAVPPTEIQRVMMNYPEFELKPVLSMDYVEFNSTAAPFDDPRVRKAFSLAINRKDVTDKVTMGGERPATGIVPYGMILDGEDFRENGKTYDILPGQANIDMAKELMEQAGYPNGQGFPDITFNVTTSTVRQRVSQVMIEMWKENLGIGDVKILVQEDKVHYTDMGEGNYQIGYASWMGDYPHPMSFLDMWMTGSGNNNTGYNSTEFDKLIKAAQASVSEKETNTFLHQAEDIWMNEHLILPIFYSTQPKLVKEYVKGFEFSPTLLVYFKYITIEQ